MYSASSYTTKKTYQKSVRFPTGGWNGRSAGILVAKRASHPPLASIHLANVQPLDNKHCELRVWILFQRETREYNLICLTETWLTEEIPDRAIELEGFFHTNIKNALLRAKKGECVL